MTRARALALTLLTSACAAGRAPTPVPSRSRAETPSSTSIQWVSAPVGPTAEPSRIGQADLLRARALLMEARNELAPRHLELLERRLTEAERAFERFDKIARTAGKTAEVARGAGGTAAAGRASAAKEIGAARIVGRLLAVLALLWPADTAGREHDYVPEWVFAQMELENALRELSRAAHQIQLEIDDDRRTSPEVDAAKRKPPRGDQGNESDPNRILPDVSNYPRGKRPCLLVAVRGNALGLPPGIRGEIKCEYNCGGKRELRFLWGTAGDAWDLCEKYRPTW